MNWTMPYPWSSRSDSVRRINMSSEPGNESFFCALRPIPRILSLRRRDYASQVQIVEPSRRKTISGCSRAPDENRYGARCRCKEAIDQLHCSAKTRRGVEGWRGGLGAAYRLPTLSSVGASLAPPCARFHTPLIEPDLRNDRIRLSEKVSRGRPRKTAGPFSETDQAQSFMENG